MVIHGFTSAQGASGNVQWFLDFLLQVMGLGSNLIVLQVEDVQLPETRTKSNYLQWPLLCCLSCLPLNDSFFKIKFYFIVVSKLNKRFTLLTKLLVYELVLSIIDTMLYSRSVKFIRLIEVKLYACRLANSHVPSRHHSLKRLSFPCCVVLTPLSKTS